MIGHKGLRNIQLICFCAIIDKDKEGGNGVIGPLPLMQDAGNQDITEWVRLSSDNNSIITSTDRATDIMNLWIVSSTKQ